MKTRNKSHSRRHRQPASHRRGSTLLIVVALMGMLAFLGFAFYTLAVQERANALSFAQEAKTTKAPSLEPDALFDFALQQVIIGPDDAYTQSILWGGRHSLMANMYGRDRVPFNGEGVNLMQTAAGQPQVDMNFDGDSLDTMDNSNLLNFVDSAVANGGTKWGSNTIYLSGARTPATNLPDPDVNYNSPDINSLYMSYDGNAVNAAGVASRVFIPSYFRPQYLRSGGTHRTDWFLNSATANQVMRPHPNHICVDGSGAAILLGGNPVPRFVNRNDYQSLGLRRPFTFTVPADTNYYAPPESTPSVNVAGSLGVWSQVVNPTVTPTDIDLDVDTDGDGILDAILMDLGYPPIRRGDGKLVVPLFAISIRDLNGLLNVNATGNLSGNLNLGSLTATSPSGGWLGYRKTGTSPDTYVADSLSKSNQGLSTYEINILRALTADPTISADSLSNSETAYQLSYFLQQFDTNIATSTAVKPGRSVSELANLEWLLLNIGRAQFHLGLATSASPLQDAITDMFSGRNGELSRMRNFLTTQGIVDMPRPGQTVTTYTPPTWSPGAADDNGNASEGELNYATRWVHPLDFLGSGQQFRRFGNSALPGNFGVDGQPGVAGTDDDGNGVIDDFSEEGWSGSDDSAAPLYGKYREFVRNGALLWPAYSGFHSLNGNAAGAVRWGETATTGTYGTQLMQNPRWYSLLDDPTESIIDPTLMSPNYSAAKISGNQFDPLTTSNPITNDTVFGPEEMPFLQGSESDARLSDTQSRLADLMPANLVASSSAAAIRKRLTTVSSDRREYGMGVHYIGGQRSWETDPLSDPQFPPSLVAGTANPYRPQLYDLLKQVNSGGISQRQLRLNVNRLLTNSGAQLQFRQLAQQTTVGDVAAYNDRQNMARDIYTLLYTLCQGGLDGDYRPPAAVVPTSAQAQEMAQFAVNLVDALDTDDIITAFVYDENLTTADSGWNISPATSTTKTVYGVERQLLTFTEAAAFRVQQASPDSQMTIFDDVATHATDGRRYLFFELQNVTPMNVTLASSGVVAGNATTTGDWRVRLTDVGSPENNYNVIYFLSGLDNANNQLQVDGSGNKYLSAGSLFTVASQDATDSSMDGKYRTSDFRADTDLNSDFNRIVPNGGTADTAGGRIVPLASTLNAQFPTPKCNLDLVWDYGDGSPSPSRFLLATNNGTAGAFVTPLTAAVPTIKLILERRATDGTANGTWVPVDKTANITINSVTPQSPATAGNIAAALATIQSNSRTTPFSRTSETPQTPGNTINTAIATVPSNSTPWQWHQDRDFASLGELLQLPICGPGDLTNGRISNSEFVDIAGTYYPTVAAARFLRPDNPDSLGTTSNRWYRLLEFLDVPNRSHQHTAIATQSALTTAPALLAEPYNMPIGFGWPRTHGQLNLNMIRDPKVLAALLDDDLLINGATPNLTGLDEGGRLWWVEFLKSRDSRFVSGSGFSADLPTGLFVPGTANARPFRSFDSAGVTNAPNPSPTDSPLENTILRSLPLDGAGTNPNESRRLFEVGLNGSEHFGQPVNEANAANNPLHSSARYRLLSKILNNTTTRSNSFGVFMTVQYYEAAQVSSDVVGVTATRIGGRLDDTPTHRGFFVVDRTGSVEQMKRLSENVSTGRITVTSPSTFPVSAQSFGFLSNSNTSGDPNYMNGIRWRDLVLFRQTLN